MEAPPLMMAWFTPASNLGKAVAFTPPGERRGVWAQILYQLPSTVSTDEERAKLRALAEGQQWIDLIPEQHKDIYKAIYEEQCQRQARNHDSNIERDVIRTFGGLHRNLWDKLRHRIERKERYDALSRMLNAVSTCITGRYCQGMNFIGGLVLLEVCEEEEAFCVFAWILRQLDVLFEAQGVGLLTYAGIFDQLTKQHLPRLHAHFQRHHFTPLLYTVEWFTTLFAISCERTLALCAFDLYLAGVDDLLLRLGVSLLAEAQEELLQYDGEGLQLHFKKVIARMPTERVLLATISTRVPPNSNRLRDVKMDMERGVIVDHDLLTMQQKHEEEVMVREREQREEGNGCESEDSTSHPGNGVDGSR